MEHMTADAQIDRLLETLESVISCDEQNRENNCHHYAKHSPMWDKWEAARATLKAFKS